MARNWVSLSPAFVMALAILVSTAIAKRTSHSTWLVLTGPLLLALAIVAADVLASSLRGKYSGPSWGALIVGTALLAACVILAVRDPARVLAMIPVLGGACAVVVLVSGAAERRKAC
jgi:hypothetical protein